MSQVPPSHLEGSSFVPYLSTVLQAGFASSRVIESSMPGMYSPAFKCWLKHWYNYVYCCLRHLEGNGTSLDAING